ncbi:hypothetical protein ACWEQ0_05830 [Nocardia thailandica]
MSDIQRGDLLPPSRHGTTWRESEYRTLADDLRAGNDLARTAAKLGRTPSAVRAALRHFVPPEEKVPGPDRERWIRQRLIAEPDWDWWACVVDAHRRTGSGLWLTRHEHSIRIGWRRRTPLPALAQELGTSELTVAEFLRGLGLVDSLEEAADRLGATPGLALAKRIAAARDASATARWILVVDGAAGTTRARNARCAATSPSTRPGPRPRPPAIACLAGTPASRPAPRTRRSGGPSPNAASAARPGAPTAAPSPPLRIHAASGPTPCAPAT